MKVKKNGKIKTNKSKIGNPNNGSKNNFFILDSFIKEINLIYNFYQRG